MANDCARACNSCLHSVVTWVLIALVSTTALGLGIYGVVRANTYKKYDCNLNRDKCTGYSSELAANCFPEFYSARICQNCTGCLLNENNNFTCAVENCDANKIGGDAHDSLKQGSIVAIVFGALIGFVSWWVLFTTYCKCEDCEDCQDDDEIIDEVSKSVQKSRQKNKRHDQRENQRENQKEEIKESYLAKLQRYESLGRTVRNEPRLNQVPPNTKN